MSETRLQAITRILDRAAKRLDRIPIPEATIMEDAEIQAFRAAQVDIGEAIKLAAPGNEPTINVMLHSIAQAEHRLKSMWTAGIPVQETLEAIKLTLVDLKIIRGGIACGNIGAVPARPKTQAANPIPLKRIEEFNGKMKLLLQAAGRELSPLEPVEPMDDAIVGPVEVAIALINRLSELADAIRHQIEITREESAVIV